MDNTTYIAFMGCGWRFPFLFGVAKFMEENIETNNLKYIGVSGGAVVAYSLSLYHIYKRSQQNSRMSLCSIWDV